MARIYVFADESGNFDFSIKRGASRLFILTTIALPDCSAGNELLQLRRDMAMAGVAVRAAFHATLDDWPTRQRVLSLIAKHPVRVDATILEKRKAQPSIRPTEERFYKMAWFLHMKHVAPRICNKNDHLFVIGASLGDKAKKKLFHEAIADVIWQVAPTVTYRTAGLEAASDPCLQIADYCCWAIWRKWEAQKDDAYRIIQAKVYTEFDVFRYGTTYFY